MAEFGKILIIVLITCQFYITCCFLFMTNKIGDITNNIIKNNVIIETQLKELNKTLKSWEVKIEQNAEQHN